MLTWFSLSPPPQTFLNPWYEASLGPIFIITLCTGLWAFVTAGGSFCNILKCLSCKGGPGGAGGTPLRPGGCWGGQMQPSGGARSCHGGAGWVSP